VDLLAVPKKLPSISKGRRAKKRKSRLAVEKGKGKKGSRAIRKEVVLDRDREKKKKGRKRQIVSSGEGGEEVRRGTRSVYAIDYSSSAEEKKGGERSQRELWERERVVFLGTVWAAGGGGKRRGEIVKPDLSGGGKGGEDAIALR